jgi:hypothetical protein
MTARCALPQRRYSETFSFSHWGREYVVGIGHHPDGRIGDVFINSGKSGEQAETLARDSAVILSLALQYGVPLSAMLHAITRDADGKPSGPIGALLEMIAEDEGLAVERAARDLA